MPRLATAFIGSRCTGTVRQGVLFMQQHWDVMQRRRRRATSWHRNSGNLPSRLRVCDRCPCVHEAGETIYVVPIKSDSEHYPLDGKLRVYRRCRTEAWQRVVKAAHQRFAPTRLLRQRAARRDGRRFRSIRVACTSKAPPAGRCTRRLTPETAGPQSFEIFPRCFPSRFRRWHDPRRSSTFHLRTLASIADSAEVQLDVRGPSHAMRQRPSTRSRPAFRCCAGRFATTSRNSADRSCGSSRASRICHTSRRTLRCPMRLRQARSLFSS